MSRLQRVEWSDEAFKSLVMNSQAKDLIHALVKQHVFTAKTRNDILWRKGGGVIGLLDGNPGCGKTLTAEAVAEVVQRPLYSLSASELGVSPQEVDSRLSMVLDVAYRWNAVVLLDEADVFLRKRDSYDVARNALVSIFLRQLEYFQGIMIMTTNRIKDCDAAFESRVHFSIHYPDLDADAQATIWRNLLNTVGQVIGVESEVGSEALESLVSRNLNGREVCNHLNTLVSCTASLRRCRSRIPLRLRARSRSKKESLWLLDICSRYSTSRVPGKQF